MHNPNVQNIRPHRKRPNYDILRLCLQLRNPLIALRSYHHQINSPTPYPLRPILLQGILTRSSHTRIIGTHSLMLQRSLPTPWSLSRIIPHVVTVMLNHGSNSEKPIRWRKLWRDRIGGGRARARRYLAMGSWQGRVLTPLSILFDLPNDRTITSEWEEDTRSGGTERARLSLYGKHLFAWQIGTTSKTIKCLLVVYAINTTCIVLLFY